jgi:hypothetical protein
VPRYETHPPFYYSVLRLWTLVFGNGLLALRALGIVAGIATPFVIALAGREAARLLEWDMSRRRRVTFVAFALASVAIPLVDMARQVRPYPLMILVYAGAIVALLRLAHTGSIRSRAFVVYLLLLEAMLWLHNMGPLFAVALTFALGIAVLNRRFDRRDGIRLIVGHAVVALAYLPGLMILLGQASGWVASTWLRFDPAVLGTRLPSLYAAPGWPLLAAFLLAGLAVAACWRSSPGRRLVGMLSRAGVLPRPPVGPALGDGGTGFHCAHDDTGRGSGAAPVRERHCRMCGCAALARPCLREVGDQIVGVLDADRDAHQIVGDAERILAFLRNRKMRHCGGMAGKRLGTAEADRKLSDFQRVEETEALFLSALDNSEKVDPAPVQWRSKISFWRAS